MEIRRPVLAVAFVACGIAVTTLHAASEPSPASWRALTFDDRVEAQRAIERVYWSHRVWPAVNPTPKPPLEAVLPDEGLRAKVDDYLAKSTALARIWDEPITAEQLQAELERMAVETRAPHTLRELFAALGHDPLVIAETLARQTLVDRRIRSEYARDARLHEETRQSAENALRGVIRATELRSSGARYVETTWRKEDVEPGEWESLQSALPGTSVGGLRETDTAFEVEALLERHPDLVRTAKASWPKVPFDVWWERQANSERDELAPAERTSFSTVDVAEGTCNWNSWKPTTTNGAPFHRSYHTAVWTGTEMIIWGGWEDDGGRYNPATNSWQPTSITGIPPSTLYNTAVWTGTEMIVWGGEGDGFGQYNTGGRYDPQTDTWTGTALSGAPGARSHHTAVWTGSRMVVWGGWNNCAATCDTYLNTGGRYNPANNSWTSTSTVSAPTGRAWHTAVWTDAGGKMIVWGGKNGTVRYNTGGRYDPVADSWAVTSTVNVPAVRADHTAVWTGTEMIVWGGQTTGGALLDGGGRYNPVGNSWIATSTTDAPSVRTNHTAVWTGTEMIVWGGGSVGSKLNTGGRYDPSTDAWIATSTIGAPFARDKHSAAWTDSEMIVWGGLGNSSSTDTGGRYCGLPCTAPIPWYRDADLDGYGNPSDQQLGCGPPTGYVANAGDCNDASGAVHPGAPEGCNGIDDNCNAQTDEDSQGVDSDADGVHNVCDNCWSAANPDQQNSDSDLLGNACDNCPVVPNIGQANADGDAAGDVCDACPLDAANDADADGRCANVDNCPGVANAGQEDGDVDLVQVVQWGASAVASSEYSPGDFSAMQATGPPDSPRSCADLETNWSPEPDGPVPEWLEVTYGTVAPAVGATVHEAFHGSFVFRVELRDAGGALHTVWEGGDATACGQEFTPSWPATPYNVAGVRVHTAIDGWEEIDALGLVGLESQPVADGFGDACDTCPALHNPGQGPIALWYGILATDADHLGWSHPLTVEFVRGDLATVGTYATLGSGSLTDALALDISGDAVAPGQGLYYLVKFPGACGSWQSTIGAEPARDAALP